MNNAKQVQLNIGQLLILQTVTEAYSQIASMQLQKVRQFVLQNREFMQDINEIFRQVLVSYKRQIAQIAKKQKRGEAVTFLSHNGKTAAVFLSANTGLYGDIIAKTFNAFVKGVEETGAEAVIIGKLGRTLYEQARPGATFSYFEYPDDASDQEKLAQVIKHLVAYEKIHVYYGKFKNAAIQSADMFEISAVTPGEEESEEDVEHYIFEPSLEKMLMFFETEIFASLLDQTLRESQLAKVASRITAMSKASENIIEELEKMKFNQLKAHHARINKKQIDSLSSILHLRRR